jgi:hypothetical protein
MLTLRTAAIAVAMAAALAAAGACSKDKGDEPDDTTTGETSDAASAAQAKPADAAPKASLTDGKDAGGDLATPTDGGATAATDPIDAAPAGDTKPPPKDEKKLTNIKVLPKSWSYAKVEKYMKTYERALGQECDFCHDEDDFADDGNKHKKIARDMITMQNSLNRKYFKGQSKITCYTCHQGKKEPK